MPRIYQIVLSLPLVVVSATPSMGADSPAIKALKEKGLTRSGRLFVLDTEEAALEKWKAQRSVLAEYTATVRRKDEAEMAARQLAQLEAQRVELQENLNALNQQINLQGFQQRGIGPGGFAQGAYVSQLIARRNMIGMNLAQVVSTQKSVKAEAGPDQKALEAESKKSLEAARAALAELRAAFDTVTKRYDELRADSAVKSSLQALEKDRVGTFRLGPSAAFKAAAKALENAERTILAKRTATTSRKKGRSRS